jgi:hypothetical protein
MKAKVKEGVGAQGHKNVGKAMVAPKAKKGMVVSKNKTLNPAGAGLAKYGKAMMKKGGAMKKGK